ncbi:MAG: nucleotide exchange factor GrpE [Verrucomicrobiota bacterium]
MNQTDQEEPIEEQIPEEEPAADDPLNAEDLVSDEQVELATEEPTPETPAEEVERWKDVAARSQAELENFRKRMAREKSEAIQFANRGLLEGLFPIIDNFEMGLKAAQGEGGDASVIYQGMAMVFKQMGDFLTEQGVEVIESDGVVFDPNLHEAIKQESSDTVADGVVIYTVRRGYRLKDRVLRAANVVVSSGPEVEE